MRKLYGLFFGLLVINANAGVAFQTGQVLTANQLNAAFSQTANAADLKAATGATLIGTLDGSLDNALALRPKKTDLAATTGASSIGFSSNSSAIARTVSSKLQDTVSVKDFGAIGDGATNDTTAILAATNYAQSNGVQVYIPAGRYWFDGGAVLGNGEVIKGDGRNATIIISRLSTPTNGYLFNASGYGSGLKDIGFIASPAQTSGSYVTLTGTESFITDFAMNGQYNGILMTGGVARIRHGRFTNTANQGISIRAEGGDTSQVIDDVMIGGQTPEVAVAGIRVRNNSALIISNTSVIQQNIGLLIDPYANTQGSSTDAGGVYSLWVHDSFFDTQGINGIKIAPSGTASVVRSRFNNDWTSSAGADGFVITNTGSGMVNGIQITNNHSMMNKGAGLSLAGILGDIVIDGGEYANNATGIYANNGTTGLRITNATIGAGGGVSGNTGNGLVILPGVTRYTVTNNDLTGNATAYVDNGVGSQAIVKDNQGLISSLTGSATIAANSTSVTVNHGLFTTPSINDIQITQQASGNYGLYVSNITSTQFTINATTAPTAALNISWRAALSRYGN